MLMNSSTFQLTGPGLFNNTYGDKTGASGDYFQDTLAFVGGSSDQIAEVKNMTVCYFGMTSLLFCISDALESSPSKD